MAEEKEDRISALPDSLIEHILSLLPSTKEAIQTSILSKRWHNQWTHVPALIFSNSGMSDERFSRFIDNTLALLDSSSKIQKLHIISVNYEVGKDPHFNSKLHFLIRKGVEELVLEFKRWGSELRLPGYIFNHASLVKLQLYNCRIMTDGVVSWGRLKELRIDNATLSDGAIENILLGSPSLELLHLSDYYRLPRLKIASESLKKVVLELTAYAEFEILCPKLEDLKLFGNFGKSRIIFKGLWSLSCATLDIYRFSDVKSSFEILQQFQHVKELTLGSKFIEDLSKLRESDGLCNLSLNNKSLILDQPDFVRDPLGIERALSMFPGLEKLVIKDFFYKPAGYSIKYWDSNGRALKLVPCLKSFHIVS